MIITNTTQNTMRHYWQIYCDVLLVNKSVRKDQIKKMRITKQECGSLSSAHFVSFCLTLSHFVSFCLILSHFVSLKQCREKHHQ